MLGSKEKLESWGHEYVRSVENALQCILLGPFVLLSKNVSSENSKSSVDGG